MTRTKILTILTLAVSLLVIAHAQTRAQSQQGQTGRYRLLSSHYKWPGIDAEHKVVIDEGEHLFRIDTATGETSVLLFRTTPAQNGQFESFWSPIGK